MRRTVPLLLVLAGCPRPGEPEAPTAPDGSVALRFAWPEGLDLAVTATLERVRVGPSEQDQQRANASWTLATERDGEALRVVTRDVVLEDASGARGPGGVVAAMAFGAHPAFLVDAEGHLGAVVGAAALREEALAGADPSVRDRLAQRLSDEAVGDVIAEEWESLVGRHAGTTLRPGLQEQTSTRSALPMAPGVEVGTIETRHWEAVQCDGKPCVRLLWTQALDQASEAEVLEALRAGYGGAEVKDVGLLYAWELVTEPDTLVPHRFVSARRMSITLVQGDVTAQVEQADVIERTYRSAAGAYAPR